MDQKQELPVVAMFVNRSGRNEQCGRVKLVKGTPTLLLVIGVMGNQQHFKQYVSYIVAVSFIGWMKKTTDLPQVTDKLNLIVKTKT
jgi:hypothetical protein